MAKATTHRRTASLERSRAERRFSAAYFNKQRESARFGKGPDLPADLRGEDLRWINLERMRLEDVDLTGADLRRANLRGVWFEYGTNIERADFRGADLQRAHGFHRLLFRRSEAPDFRGADLRDADIPPSSEAERAYLLGFLIECRFSATMITPEQKRRMVSELGLSEGYLNSRFKTAASMSHRQKNAWAYRKALKAWERAEREGRIIDAEHAGTPFQYALIGIKGNEELHKRWGTAFSISRQSTIAAKLFGDAAARYVAAWRYFVFDIVPERFRLLPAIHELGERIRGSHDNAVALEFEAARANGLLPEYVSWTLESYRDRLLTEVLLRENANGQLPQDVVDAVMDTVRGEDLDRLRESLRNKSEGIHGDIWALAWRRGGLTDNEISVELKKRGYDVSPRAVRYYRNQMGIPGSDAIRRRTYLEP